MPQINCRTITEVQWQTVPANYDKLEAEVHIWILPVSPHALLTPELLKLLNSTEIARADSYRNERDKTRFILSRGMLRILLASYTGQLPSEIQLMVNKNKKPLKISHKAADTHYSLSHAGDIIIFAFGATALGMDIEYVDNNFPYDEVLDDCFSREEIMFLASEESPGLAFYQLWTRKEALVKATGKGIDSSIHLIPCLTGIHTISASGIDSEKDWDVINFPVSGSYTASAAIDPSVKILRFFEAGRMHV